MRAHSVMDTEAHGWSHFVLLPFPLLSLLVSPVPVRSKGRSAPPHLCLTTEKEIRWGKPVL